MNSLWKMWVDARTEEKALKLCERVLERMGRDASDKRAEPYPKTGGFVVSFAVGLEHAEWNDAVVEVIALGQRVAHGWALSGSIEDDPDGWSNRTSVAGVESIQWTLVGAGAVA
ncbi:MAG: hypothetical protein JOZ96_22825 [Acidobacteria bacterium]|nr:hypothetical protein [Acidobacteriota bacterium]